MPRTGGASAEEALLGVIGGLYDAAIDPALMAAALERMMVASGAVGGSIHEPHANEFNPRKLTTPSLADFYAEYDRSAFWRLEPRVRLIRESWDRPGSPRHTLAAGGIVTDLDLLAPRDCDRHAYYQDILRPNGIRYGAYFWTNLSGRRLVFAASRAVKAGPFGAGDLTRMRLLRGHLDRALRISAELASARSVSRGVIGMLSSLGMAALLVDSEARVVFANAAAEQLDGVAFLLRRRRLVAVTASDQASIDRLVGAALDISLNATRLAPIKLRCHDRVQPFLMQAVPLSAAAAGNELLLAPASAIVIVADPEQRSAGDPQAALRLLGLTWAEARIAFWSGHGLSAAEVGERVRNTEGTVRFSLKRIYQKLGVARQAELALVVAKASAISALGGPAGV